MLTLNIPLQVREILVGLAAVVVGTELGNQLGSIVRSVRGQHLGDDQQGIRKLSHSQLLSTCLKPTLNLS